VGLLLDGCTKCGPIWDDWLQSPKACKSVSRRAVCLVPRRLQ